MRTRDWLILMLLLLRLLILHSNTPASLPLLPQEPPDCTLHVLSGVACLDLSIPTTMMMIEWIRYWVSMEEQTMMLLVVVVVVSDHDFAAAKACGPCDCDQRADPPPASSFLSCP